MRLVSGEFLSARRGQEGVALMLVLVFILLLSVLVGEYAYETQVNASLIANGTDDLEAYVAAKSAVASGMGLLLADLMETDVENTMQSGTQALVVRSGQEPMDAGLGGDYDSYLDVWGQGVPYQTINNAIMQCTIEDEGGKLNLNALFPNPEELEPNPVLTEALRNLFELFEVEEDPTDAILDWIDTDEDTRPNGAESDYYGSLETPYACKNGPMDSINELLLVVGITPELFFDCNLDPSEPEMQEYGEDPRTISLLDFLTVRGNLDGRINVNTAQPELLDALVMACDGGDPGIVDTILEARMEEPFRSVQDLQSRLFGTQNNREQKIPGQELLDVKSDFFRIIGDGESNEVMVEINAYVYRATAEGMAATDSQGIMPESFRILEWQVIR